MPLANASLIDVSPSVGHTEGTVLYYFIRLSILRLPLICEVCLKVLFDEMF